MVATIGSQGKREGGKRGLQSPKLVMVRHQAAAANWCRWAVREVSETERDNSSGRGSGREGG